MESVVRKLCCQGCGAILPVAEGVRYLTCNYCDARLEIVTDAATTHTRLLNDIDQRTRKIERDVELIRCRGELEQLDQSWGKYEARVIPRDDKGRRTSAGGTLILFGLISAVIGVALLFSEAWWMGIVLFPAAGWFVVRSIRFEMRAHQLHQACRLKYEMRRRQLLQKLGGHR